MWLEAAGITTMTRLGQLDPRHASPRYAALAPRTARDYDKVLKWVTEKLGKLEVERMQRRDIIQARDANVAKVRFANYIV
ncbi:hypothetical protein [Pseudogemmobacter faecipullorum]|uniref:Uncharacterized protein n=1 Tax=Pseudogemmobacter faecipullorum TaxID=2755041 RepID=A0ABS8CRB8_9RHOB|nr:hypothetical protein [Pseudogemmobacter faecipullorum]MCB5411918.1 hypothetical protein [Pseudogemmobacter faecipullorum]